MNTPPPITLTPTGRCDLTPVALTTAELQARLADLEARCEAAESTNVPAMRAVYRAERDKARSKASALEDKLNAISYHVASIDMWSGDTIVERIGAILAEVVA